MSGQIVTAEINEQGNRIRLEAPFNDKDLLMTIPGARWDRDDLFVHIPLTFPACKQLRAILDERLEIGNPLYGWAANEIQSRIYPCLNLREATGVSDPKGLCDGLYPFQQAGAHFLIAAQQAILADMMGAGKTVQAISAARYIEEQGIQGGAFPVLVVCPNSTKISWLREWEKWDPDAIIFVIQGTEHQRQALFSQIHGIKHTCKLVVIVNWESVRLHSRLAPYGTIRRRDCSNCNRQSNEPSSKCERCLKDFNQIDWKLVIVDEAHRMANPQSKQTRAVWGAGINAPWKWALTGTPLTNKPDSLWSLLHFIHPEEHPSKTKFIQRYCDSAPSRWGPGLDIFGLSEGTKEEFFEIFDPRFRRMPKEVVLPNLPPIQRIRKYVEMTPEQRRSYETMAEDMIAFDENGELLIAMNPISKLTRLVQYSSACIKMEGDPVPRARLTDPSCKLDALMEDLPDYLEAGESVVVFAVSRQLIEMAETRLTKAKIPFSVIKGNQTADFRQSQLDAFQDGKVPVILVVVAAGGVGINLTAGRIAIFLQRPWSNVDYEQAMARIHRIGSEIHESIMIVDYLTEGTIENYQLRTLEGKAEQLEAVVRDRETIRRLLFGDEE